MCFDGSMLPLYIDTETGNCVIVTLKYLSAVFLYLKRNLIGSRLRYVSDLLETERIASTGLPVIDQYRCINL